MGSSDIVISNGVGDHEISTHTGNGYGTTNTKIRRYTTTLTNVGTAISYSDSATLGASFLINETGLYSLYMRDCASDNITVIGISLNSSQLSTAIYSVNVANIICIQSVHTANALVSVSRVVRLISGDIIRPHNVGNISTNDGYNQFFSIRKVGV